MQRENWPTARPSRLEVKRADDAWKAGWPTVTYTDAKQFQVPVNTQTLACDKDKGVRVLDVGCGTGSLLFRLADALPAASLVGIDVSPANRHDTKAIVPVLRELADGGFQGPALGDLGYRGKRLAEAGQALGITVEAIARGRDGQFIPAGICWVVERSFAWLSRYRRLNTIFERSKEHLIAFVAIAFISILSRRLKRLVVEELSA